MKKLIIAAFLMTTLTGCFLTDWIPGGEKNITIKTAKGDIELTVEVADSDSERAEGLMNRDELGDTKGMLFVFSDEAPRQFWMKNTKIPLDIIFFGGNKKVVSVVENMEPCTTPQCISYDSEVAAQYAVEVRAGFVKNYDVRIGDEFIEKE